MARDLRIYSTTSIKEAADELVDQHRLGAINSHQMGAGLGCYVLRDPEGVYHAYDGRQGRWYRYAQAVWQVATAVPERLEGAVDLPVDRPGPEDDTADALAVAAQGENSNTSITQALVHIARMISERYAAGRITLDDGYEILRDYILMDRKWRLWMVGVRTGRWHAFAEGKWKASKTPPADEDLLSLGQQNGTCQFCVTGLNGLAICPNCHKPVPPPVDLADEQTASAVADALIAAGSSLPESLSDPWNPPAWYPDAVQIDGLVCTTCQEDNKAGSNFCNRCGTVLAPIRMESALPTSHKFCTHCGAELKPGKKFCSSCGKPIAEKADRGLPR